jgi:hypothetical protein
MGHRQGGSLIDNPKPELDGKTKKRLRGKANKNGVLAGRDPEISTHPRKCSLAPRQTGTRR